MGDQQRGDKRKRKEGGGWGVAKKKTDFMGWGEGRQKVFDAVIVKRGTEKAVGTKKKKGKGGSWTYF